MSSTTTTTRERPDDAYNWNEKDWFESQDLPGHTDDEDDEPDAVDEYTARGQGTEWGVHHSFLPGRTKEEVFAHKFLRHVGRLLCARTLLDTPNRGADWVPAYAYIFNNGETLDHDPDALHHENREVELTDPRLHIPKMMPDAWGNVDYGSTRYRRRLNTDTGYITGGESTSVLLADLPEPVFMEAVDLYLSTQNHPPDREAELRGIARSLKSEGQLRDKDILERVIYAATNDHDPSDAGGSTT